MEDQQNDDGTTNSAVTECGALCDDGTECERRQRAEQCYLHDGDVPDDHGAPEGHTNSVTHGLEVSTDKFIHEVLDDAETVYLYEMYEGFLCQSRYNFDVEYDDENRPVATTNCKQARDLLRAAVGMLKQIRATTTNVENGYLSEDGSNIGYLNIELTDLSERVYMRLRRGGVSGG